MKKIFRYVLLVTAMTSATALTSTAMAADKVLKVASWLPTTHGMNERFWPEFKTEVEKLTEGRVKVEIEYGLAPPNGTLELVEYGGADISWTFHGYFPGRFTTTKMVELPGYPGNSEAASVAHWRVQEKFFDKAGEFEGVKLIGLFTHAPADLVMGKGKAIKSLADLKGRKMRIAGGVSNEVAKALEVAPVLASVTKNYEMISGGMADGTFLPMDTIQILRLYEVAPNAYNVPGGFYRGSFSVFMNEDSWDGISEQDRKALEAYFGEKLSQHVGSVWDWDHARGLKAQEKQGEVTALSDADVKKLGELTAGVKDKVIKEVTAKGIDGQAAYDFIMETMKNYK